MNGWSNHETWLVNLWLKDTVLPFECWKVWLEDEIQLLELESGPVSDLLESAPNPIYIGHLVFEIEAFF